MNSVLTAMKERNDSNRVKGSEIRKDAEGVVVVPFKGQQFAWREHQLFFSNEQQQSSKEHQSWEGTTVVPFK